MGYLLTVDNNANPNDGIVVNQETLVNATTYNTDNGNSSPADVDLSELSSILDATDSNYAGAAPTTTDVNTQVANAVNAQCVRDLIGGQTWYIAGALSSEVTKYVVDVPVVNTLVTQVYPTLPNNTNHPTASEQVMVVGDQLWIELDIGQGNGVGRDFAKFQACKANSPIYPNYLEARFYTGSTNYLASLTAGTPYRWYNNYNDALTYALTGQ